MTLPAWCSGPPTGGTDEPEHLHRRLRAADRFHDQTPVIATSVDAAEQQLVERIRAGDLAVFEQVYRATYPPLWRFAYRMVQSVDVAQDIVHDVFFSLWARRQRWSIHTTVRAYLYGAVRQRALKDVRHQRVVSRAAQAIEAIDAIPPGMGDATEAPDTQAEREAVVAALRHAILTLPERQRLAMLLYLEGDLTPVEIAAALDISAAAARKLLAKGVAHLRSILPEP